MKNVLFLLAFLCAINLWGQSGAIPPPATDTATWSKIKIKTAMNNFSESYYDIAKHAQRYMAQNPTDTSFRKKFGRWDFIWSARITPDGKFEKGFQSLATLGQQTQVCSTSGSWKSMFQRTTNNCQFSQSGRIDAVFSTPQNRNLIYAGSDAGGLWRTTDGGNNWTCITDELRVIGLAITSIVEVSDNEIWFSTGFMNGVIDNAWSKYGAGIFRLRENGGRVSPTTVFIERVETPIVILAGATPDPHPWNPFFVKLVKSGNEIFALSSGLNIRDAQGTLYEGEGVIKRTYSNANNTTWTLVKARKQIYETLNITEDNVQFTDMTIIPGTNIIALGTQFGETRINNVYTIHDAHLFLTTTNGNNLPGITSNIAKLSISNFQFSSPNANIGRIYLGTSLAKVGHLFIGFSELPNNSWSHGHILRMDLRNSINTPWVELFNGAPGGLDHNPSIFKVSNVNPHRFYMGKLELGELNTQEGTVTTTGVNTLYSQFDCNVHADVRAIQLIEHPTNVNQDIILIGTDGGVSKTNGNLNNWLNLNDNNRDGLNMLSVTEYYDIAVSSKEKEYIAGGTQDNGTPRSRNGRWDSPVYSDGGTTIIDWQTGSVGYTVGGPSYSTFNMPSGGSIDIGLFQKSNQVVQCSAPHRLDTCY